MYSIVSMVNSGTCKITTSDKYAQPTISPLKWCVACMMIVEFDKRKNRVKKNTNHASKDQILSVLNSIQLTCPYGSQRGVRMLAPSPSTKKLDSLPSFYDHKVKSEWHSGGQVYWCLFVSRSLIELIFLIEFIWYSNIHCTYIIIQHKIHKENDIKNIALLKYQ